MQTDESLPPVITPQPQPAPPMPLAAPRRAAREPNPLVAIILYLLVVFIGAALAAPRFHASAQFIAEHAPSWRFLAEYPFHRYVGRSLLLLALVGLPIFIKALRIHSARSIGLVLQKRNWGEGAQGLIWGLAAMAVVGALAVSSGVRTWHAALDGAELLRHARNALATAFLVATIEEILFRGAMFSALRRRYSFGMGAFLAGGIFAILHFLRQPDSPAVIEWHSGFTTLAEMLGGFTDWQALVPAFFNLLLLAVLLSMTLERTGSLLFAIGLHAGLVFGVKMLGSVTRLAPDVDRWAWGGAKFVDGWATGLILLCAFFALRAILPPPRRPADV